MYIGIAESDRQSDDKRPVIAAINRLAAVLEIDPTDVEAMHAIADAHNALGDSKTAMVMHERAAEIAPNSDRPTLSFRIVTLDEEESLVRADEDITLRKAA